MHDSVIQVVLLTCASPRCEIWYQRVVELREWGEDNHLIGEPNVSTVEPSLRVPRPERAEQDDAPECFRRVRLKFQEENSTALADVYRYLNCVKSRFAHQPEVYTEFLIVFANFQTSFIGVTGVIDRVSRLFASHPDLIQGFNSFLPERYGIERESGYVTT